MVVLIAVAIAALVAMEVWWFNQPIPLNSDAALDINTATVSELTALSGVDEPTANNIVDGRPYMKKDELMQKKVIPQATYDKIKDQIVAKQK